MKVAIIRFSGTNCEFNIQYAFGKLGVKIQIIWHEEREIDTDLVVLSRGFLYGDYLRCVAIAKIVSTMRGVIAHAKRGGYTLGICNGFQILSGSGLLEGAMKHNNSLSFISKNRNLRVVSNDNVFLKNFQKDEVINPPVAYGKGNYYADEAILKKMRDKDLILLKYGPNPNGPVSDIAGTRDENKEILGLMFHPERACDKVLGNDIGLRTFEGSMRE